MAETYVFKVGPGGETSATYYGAVFGPFSCVTMDEWDGRSLEDFARGMKGRGFKYRNESYELSRGRFTEHYWER